MERIHFLLHAPFETPAYITTLVNESRHAVSCTCLWESTTFPEPEDIELLVVMGGPMNIYEHDRYPWLIQEKAFLRQVIDKGNKVLGICLGSQLLADALGGTVVRNRCKEIGWYPVTLTKAAMSSPLLHEVPQVIVPLHWHGDTYPPPPGAVMLGSSEACANQGFFFDNRVVGLQFHLEMTQESIEQMISACGDELVSDEFVMTAKEIRGGTGKYLDSAQAVMRQILRNLIE